jgi:hypothetical protein
VRYIIDWNCVKVQLPNGEEECSPDGVYFVKYEDGEVEYISEKHEFDKLFRMLNAQRRRKGYFGRLADLNRKFRQALNP